MHRKRKRVQVARRPALETQRASVKQEETREQGVIKIVINQCHGGFGLSKAAYEAMGIPWDGYGFAPGVSRDDPKLVAVVESLGSNAASGSCARLGVIEIPEGVRWIIEEYDGYEHIAEEHRTWP